jgi:Tfp pilus assembly protein PilO
MALRPTLVTISGLFGQIRQQKELSERLDKKILAVRNAVQEMDKVEGELPLLYEMIPTSPEWDRFADEIYRAATNSGMMIQSIAIDKIPNKATEAATSKQTSEVVPSGIIPIKFTVSGKGEYEQFIKMLTELEKNKRLPIFTLATIDIDKNGQLNLNLSGEIGYMPVEKAL